MAVLLGLIVAASYGAADFCGGWASKRSSTVSVVVVSQACSLGLLAVLLLLDHDTAPRGGDLALGAAAGAIGCAGLLLLYRGLAVGRMSVVAPTTAIGAALVPLAWGVATGERPGPAAAAGAAVALAAVVLVARSPDEDVRGAAHRGDRTELVLSVAAGACFGAVFTLLGSTSDDSGFWPLLAARPTSVVLLAAGALAAGQAVRPARADVPLVVMCGLLDLGANAMFLLAARRGLLSLTGVLASLYPAATVLLAASILHERIRRSQALGLALAAAGVMLIAAG